MRLLLSALLVLGLAGCSDLVTPASSPAESAGSLGSTDTLLDEEFTLRLVSSGNDSARSVTGFTLALLESASKGGSSNQMINFMQLLVVDSKGAIISVSESRREGPDDSAATFTVDHVYPGEIYNFLLLMGHWDRVSPDSEIERGANKYIYANNTPTLLKAGFKAAPGGAEEMTILVRRLEINAQFVPLSGSPPVAGTPIEGTSGITTLFPGTWGIIWTIPFGTYPRGGLEHLFQAQEALGLTVPKAVFKSINSYVNGQAQPNSVGFDGAQTITQTIGTFTFADAYAGTINNANFRLEYVPFGLDVASTWSGHISSYWTSLGYDTPRWMIRNGLNNTPQNEQTDFGLFDISGAVGMQPTKNGGTVNGNGSIRYKAVVAPDEENLKISGSIVDDVIHFTGTEYTGLAEVYYATGESEPALSAYTILRSSVAPNTTYLKDNPADSNATVWVILHKEGKIGTPIKLNQEMSPIIDYEDEEPDDSGTDGGGGGDDDDEDESGNGQLDWHFNY
jgi:hypothetical protein